MPPKAASNNGKVSLALIQREIKEIGLDVSIIKEKLEPIHDHVTRQEQFNNSVKSQLWDDGCSRIQQAEQKAEQASAWAKGALVPIALAVALGLISLIWR